MEFRILGSIEARVDGAPVALRGTKPRALLARLLIDAGRAVPMDRIVDDLWGERVPESAVKMVQIHVSALRKVLGPGVLTTRPPGYALEVAPESIDAIRFARLRVEGSAALAAGDPRTASVRLSEALALWHGHALADLGEPFAAVERASLEGLRLAALEERIEADLQLGRDADAIGELEAMIADHPLRERPRGMLMLALYRTGRQAEALSAYLGFRARLNEELGIEPTLALRDLQTRILRQDPELLQAPAATPRSPRAPGELQARPGAVRYTQSGGVNIAYQVVGDGNVDVVFVPGFVSHQEVLWEEPATARFFARLASFGRLILHDKREQGLSDRLGRPPALEESMEDLVAVMDAAGSRRAALVGISEGGPLSLLFAATHPERVSALVGYGSYAKLMATPDHPIGLSPDFVAGWREEIMRTWGGALSLDVFAPSLVEDLLFRAWWSRLLRTGTSPRGAEGLFDLVAQMDVRQLLPAITVPTLIVHRADDILVPVACGRELALGIRGAEYVELPGHDHLWMAGDQEALLDQVERFVTRRDAHLKPERLLQTVLSIDVVNPVRAADSVSGYAGRLDEHLRRHRGRRVIAGESDLLAAFDGPARGIECARAIRDDLRAFGLELRAGLHAGECELLQGELGGLAVLIGARVGELAAPGEVLVSSTVKELVVGSSLRFTKRSTERLDGVPGVWRLYALAD